MTDHADRPSRRDLAQQADAILRRARFDTITGANKDRQYRRNKRAERKRLARHWRAKRKRLGTFGPASPVRAVACAQGEAEKKDSAEESPSARELP